MKPKISTYSTSTSIAPAAALAPVAAGAAAAAVATAGVAALTMCLADTHTETDPGLAHCSYGSWQPRYAAVTAASRVIDLDQAVVDFLQEDGLVLPEESHAVSDVDLASMELLLRFIELCFIELINYGRAAVGEGGCLLPF